MAVGLAASYHVIPRKGEALTWESPGTILRFVVQAGEWYQEIATPVCRLARNDMVIEGWLHSHSN